MAYDNSNTFTLFRNNKGDNPKRPDYRGEININGTVYELAAWTKESKKDGKKFFSGSVKRKEAPKPVEARRDPPQTQAVSRSSEDIDEDVPF